MRDAVIVPDDLSDAQVRALLEVHFAGMLANSPADHCHFLDFDGLKAGGVSFWTAWDGAAGAPGALMACGAMKELDSRTGEIKSMRTHADHLRRGAAAALLRHIIAEARARGYSRLSLETGSGAAFEPAIALYRAHGFVTGEPFADYEASDFNNFMHLDLPG